MADARISPNVPVTAVNLHETLKLRAMEAIVRKSHCFEGAFVFGGYVRDYIINHVLPKDVDLSFKSTDDITTFLRILSELYEVDHVEKHVGYGWGARRFETWKARVGAYGSDGTVARFTVDLVAGAREGMAKAFCDFTCNLLCLSRTSLELVAVPDSMRFQSSPVQDVLVSISAREFGVVKGTIPLLQSEVGPYAAKLCRRAFNMVTRGWTMTAGPTFRAFVRTKGASTEAECSICKSEFEDDEVVIQTLCNHTFHSSCISTWLLEGRSTTTCPVCREVNFMIPASSITIIQPPKPEADEDDEDDDDDSDYEPDEDEVAIVSIEVPRTQRR